MLPTFELETEKTAEEVLHCVREAVRESEGAFEAQFTEHHALINIDQTRRHFWSPWMNLEVRSTESKREVFVRFSPHPNIWTGFMFCYFAIAFLIFFATMFGMSQQLVKQTAWAYGLIPVGLVIALGLWSASQIGQKLAHAEMRQMKSAIQKCITGQQGPVDA